MVNHLMKLKEKWQVGYIYEVIETKDYEERRRKKTPVQLSVMMWAEGRLETLK